MNAVPPEASRDVPPADVLRLPPPLQPGSARWWRHQAWMWLSGLLGSRYDGLYHFEVVRPGVLLRCGQPRVSELRRIHDAFALRTVIAARGGTRHPLRGQWFARERDFCQHAGIRFVHMPFTDQAAPPADLFDRFIDLLRQPDSAPALVHCEQGIHRTGVLVAAYRVALERAALSVVLNELHAGGFDPADMKRAALLAAFRDWAARHDSAAAFVRSPT
ncbi:MAG: hypothetical protein CHACPFDD_03798 [Phycisphaerae bacterium]|nr:hypothetical protein [Phycisphaerae bacterium]